MIDLDAPLTDEERKTLETWRFSLAEHPLHDLELHPGQYFACDFPERPDTEETCWDYRCRGCWLHAEAVLRANPAATTNDTYFDGRQFGIISQACYVRLARAFHSPEFS
jgi:hypothetical protein